MCCYAYNERVSILKKHSKVIFFLVLIVALYFLVRIPSLTYQPIFADEAIYVRWAQIAKAEPTLRFISLQDGKTPFYMWMMAPFLELFTNPLFAGRLLSVISGFVTLLGVFWIGKTYFSIRAGLFGALLVAITPFMIFFDRMALVDSMLAAFTIWIIYWALKLAHEQNAQNAIILGLLLGAGWLTKTPGMVNVALLPMLGLFFDFKKSHLKPRLVKFGSYFAGSAFIAVFLYLIQRIDPNFHQLSSRNSDYIHPLTRLLEYPLDPLIPHFKDTIAFSYGFFGPIVILIPFILWMIYKTKSKVAVILLLWSLIPFVYELEFIKAYTARYILYCIPPLLLLGGVTLDWLIERLKILGNAGFVVVGLFFAASLSWMVYFVIPLHTNLATLPIANAERRGYLEDWTAGYGLDEIANYLILASQNETVVVGTEGGFGTLPDGLVIHLDRYFHTTDTQKIVVVSGKGQVSDALRNFSKEKPTFFVANKSRYPFAEPGLTLIQEYKKVEGQDLPQDSILFYRVNPIPDDKVSQ